MGRTLIDGSHGEVEDMVVRDRKHLSYDGVVLPIVVINPTSFEFSVDSGGKVTARYTQDLGAKAADLNGKIEELRFKVDELAQDISGLKRAKPLRRFLRKRLRSVKPEDEPLSRTQPIQSSCSTSLSSRQQLLL